MRQEGRAALAFTIEVQHRGLYLRLTGAPFSERPTGARGVTASHRRTLKSWRLFGIHPDQHGCREASVADDLLHAA